MARLINGIEWRVSARRLRRTRRMGLMSAVLGAGMLMSAPAFAQRDQPIYPAYDGFLKNPDGSFTIAYAYFSHNAETVTIPPGADNSFGAAPADRQQPVVFHPGHHRFQCVMVVGADFDGALKWNLAYAGTKTGTSERMLQSNWNLVEGAAELKQIDYAKVPKGVCLNRAPEVRVLGVRPERRGPAVLQARLGEIVNLFGSVEDEGLPRGVPLRATWTKVSGPGDVTFDRPGARTKATFSAAGTYELLLTATDSLLTTTYRLNVAVK